MARAPIGFPGVLEQCLAARDRERQPMRMALTPAVDLEVLHR